MSVMRRSSNGPPQRAAIRSGGVGVEHPQIAELQAVVEPFDLEPFFAAVLEQYETPHERPEEEEQPEEEAAVVGEPNP